MTDMTEKVARAIDPGAFEVFEGMQKFCLLKGDPNKDAFETAKWAHGKRIEAAKDNARAAIEAMREPSEAMLRAFDRLTDDHGQVLVKTGYRGMIDAALTANTNPEGEE